MTLAVPIFDSLGEVQMVLQCPGLIDKVRRNQAKIAVELVRAAERLSLIHGGARPAAEADSP
jgi:DNA-binding IclR family transcriptional regulator